MDDLVDRLLSLADCDARAGEPLGKCMREAADEIERLRAERDALRTLVWEVNGGIIEGTVDDLDDWEARRALASPADTGGQGPA